LNQRRGRTAPGQNPSTWGEVMKRLLAVSLLIVLTSGISSRSRADEKDVKAIIDKGIQALGGEEKLTKAGTHSVKSKGTISFGGNESEFTTHSTVQGLNHYRSEFDGKFGDNDVKGVTVVNGEKGWRKFNENDDELEGDALVNEKHRINMQLIPSTLVELKGKGFKLESAAEQKIGDKPAVGIKVTGPEGKDFTLYFDKESGLPVKLVATVAGFGGGEDFAQETTFSDYKDFDGIKKASKVSSTRNGEKFVDVEITEFKVLDKVPPETFTQPK
jgi:hypothetical protein